MLCRKCEAGASTENEDLHAEDKQEVVREAEGGGVRTVEVRF